MSLAAGLLDPLRQDLLYGLRMLRSKPGFTAVAILSIALGIGAATAIFSVIYAVLIDPYPYRAADRIGQLVLTSKKEPNWGLGYSKAQYQELKLRMRSMEEAIAIDTNEAVMTGTGLAEVVKLGQSSQNFFDFFGVPPLLGRNVCAVVPADIYRLGTTPIDFWMPAPNRSDGFRSVAASTAASARRSPTWS